MPYGYTDEEFTEFTKTERKIIAMIDDSHYEKEQIMSALDIKYGTYRGHIASIKRKRAKIHTDRFNNQAKKDCKRHKEKQLPDFDVVEKKEEELPPIVEQASFAPQTFLPANIPLEEIQVNGSILPKPSRRVPLFGKI